MPLRLLVVLALLIACALAAPTLLHADDKTPSAHEGKTYEEWTALAATDDDDARMKAIAALGHFGVQSVGPLTKWLTHPHAGTRAAAATSLGKVGPEAKAAVPTLVERCKDGNTAVRLAVVNCLSELGLAAEPAIPALLIALEDSSEDVGQAAAWTLGPLGKDVESVIPALIDIIKTTRDEHHFAGQALARVGPKATEAMGKAIEDGAPKTRKRLLLVAYEMGKDARGLLGILIKIRQKAEGELVELLDMVCAATGANFSDAIEILLTELKNGEDAQSIDAATRLGELRPVHKETVPALIEALKDTRASVRLAVIEALANLGPEARVAVVPLGATLADEDEAVQAAARKTIAAIGKDAPDLVLELIPIMLGDGPNADVMAKLLAEIGPPALPHLIKALDGADVSTQVRIAKALGGTGPEATTAVPPLLVMLRSKDEALAQAAVKALRRLGGLSVPGLTEALSASKRPLRWRALNACRGIGPAAAPATPALAKLLKDREPSVRTLAAEVLGEIGPGAAAALKGLEKNLKHKLPSVRKATALAIGHIVTSEKNAIASVARLLRDVDIPVRYAAVEALRDIGPPSRAAARDLVIALRNGAPAMRKRVLEALGDIGPEGDEVVPAVIRALGDSVASNRRAAAQTLGKFGKRGAPALDDLEALCEDLNESVADAADEAIAAIEDAQDADEEDDDGEE